MAHYSTAVSRGEAWDGRLGRTELAAMMRAVRPGVTEAQLRFFQVGAGSRVRGLLYEDGHLGFRGRDLLYEDGHLGFWVLGCGVWGD